MPINPNIALGAQPQQQPNMLGQLGQMMAIKAAQQEMEGNEGFRSALAGGMEATDPRILQYGRPGRETFKAAGEGRIKQLEAASKSNEILGGIFGGVLQDPTTGPQAVARLQSMGLMTEAQAQKVIAEAGNNPDAWRQLAKPYYEGAISAAQRLTAETSRYATNVAAGTAANRLNFDIEGRNYERANPALSRVDGENGFYLYNPRDPNSAVPLGMRPSASPPAAPPAASAAPVNGLLMTTQPTATNLNAFTGGAPNQAGPTVANAAAADAAARAAAAQPSAIRPKQPVRQPVAVMIDNKAVFVPPEKAVGLPPASADAEKAARLRAQQVKDLDLAISNLETVTKPKGLISQSTGSGFGRAMDVSAGFFGQATEGAIAGAKLAPIADLVLKMVPRFEGPQSDKDTQSYKEASAQLANTSLPTEIRRQAGIEVLRIMKARKDQFVSSAMNNEGLTSGSSAGGADPLGIRQ